MGVKTFAMMSPLLPKTWGLVTQLFGKVDYVLIDRMNYHYADRIYKRYKLENAMTDNFFKVRFCSLNDQEFWAIGNFATYFLVLDLGLSSLHSRQILLQ